jgi:hypothetical protein
MFCVVVPPTPLVGYFDNSVTTYETRLCRNPQDHNLNS